MKKKLPEHPCVERHACPTCGALAGVTCRTFEYYGKRTPTEPHMARIMKHVKAGTKKALRKLEGK